MIVLAGCGGSGGSSGGGSGNDTGPTEPVSASYGLVTTRSFGGAQPPVAATGMNATVYGIAGASFAQVTATATPGNLIPPLVGRLAVVTSGELSLRNADGSQLVSLTPGFSLAANPQISPDGRQIVYDHVSDLYLINADGSNDRLFVQNASQGAWSPDGQSLVFVQKGTDGYTHLYTIKLNGTQLQQITDVSYNDADPTWSPDGSQIAFSRSGQNSGNIAVCATDGSSARIVTSPNSGADSCPTWSPDGTTIAYLHTASGTTTVDTTNPANGITKVIGTLGAHFRPTYSPDGKSIYVSASNGSVDNLFVNTVGSTIWTNLTTSSLINDDAPSFSPATASTPQPTATNVYVGSDGAFGASCAGFLFGQIDRTISGFASFDTVSSTVSGRSVTRISALSQGASNAQNLVFSLSTTDDTPLGSFQYANGSATPTTVLPSADVSSATGMIVTFSAVDGGVSTVLPFDVTKAPGQGKPKTVQSGSTLQISAHFLGVWDKTGHNLAPRGASQVQIDTSTGALKSFS